MKEGFQVSISRDLATKARTTNESRQSWWIEAKTREEFYAKVREEQSTMRQSEFGQLGTRGTDSLQGGRPR